MTERYRLALIAHHAEELAELIEEQSICYKKDKEAVGIIWNTFRLRVLSKKLNELINKEETNG